MTALLLVALQASPIDLPTDSVTAVNDRLLGLMGRGGVVSEDGKAVYSLGQKGITIFRVDASNLNETGFFLRKSDKDATIYTGAQQYPLEQKGVKDWEDPHIISIVRAPDEEHITFAFTDDARRYGVATVKWIDADPDAAKTIYTAPEGVGFSRALPDSGSMDTYFDFFKLADRVGTGYGRGGSADRIEIKPGFQPVYFDSNAKRYLGYTYSESGFPGAYSIRGMGSADSFALPPLDELRVMGLAWLPGGRVLAYFDRRFGDDVKGEPGTYLLDEKAKSWKKVGSCSIEGQSASGRFLLLSDLKERKSWIVKLKG